MLNRDVDVPPAHRQQSFLGMSHCTEELKRGSIGVNTCEHGNPGRGDRSTILEKERSFSLRTKWFS